MTLEGMEPVDRTSDRGSRCDLVVAGNAKGASHTDVGLMVAIETVVPDNEIPEILLMYSTLTRTDADGHFVDRYDVPDDVRHQLHGWVMCTVVVQPHLPGASGYTKVVRWQRQSSGELIAGLSALLATVSFDIGLSRADRARDGGSATTSWFGQRLR